MAIAGRAAGYNPIYLQLLPHLFLTFSCEQTNLVLSWKTPAKNWRRLMVDLPLPQFLRIRHRSLDPDHWQLNQQSLWGHGQLPAWQKWWGNPALEKCRFRMLGLHGFPLVVPNLEATSYQFLSIKVLWWIFHWLVYQSVNPRENDDFYEVLCNSPKLRVLVKMTAMKRTNRCMFLSLRIIWDVRRQCCGPNIGYQRNRSPGS